MLELALKSLLAYLLGSAAGALVLGHVVGVDIRTLGSGNAGATNALRTRGPRFALGVLVIDLGKGIVGAALVPRFALPPADPAVSRLWLGAACAAAVVIGHVYPVWFGFRGGKGAATLIGALIGLAPAFALVIVLVWLGMLFGSGYVGLSTIVAACSAPLMLLTAHALGYGAKAASLPPLLCFAVFAALLTVFTHRANLARLRAGTEPKVRGLRRGNARR